MLFQGTKESIFTVYKVLYCYPLLICGLAFSFTYKNFLVHLKFFECQRVLWPNEIVKHCAKCRGDLLLLADYKMIDIQNRVL